MTPQDEALLTAVHFAPVGDGVWVYRKRYVNEDDGNERNAVVVLKERPDGRFEGYVPMVDDPVANGEDAVPARGLRVSTVDVRDIVALTLGEKASAMLEVYGTTTEIGFEEPKTETWVTMPFHGDPYGDYAITKRSPSGAYHELANPRDVFGDAYLEWRDEYCSKSVPAGPTP